ncbi:FAD-dependent oxidoreductase [Symbioplanes lichenis]|uniref:FAD-dependent oxidoreductase n=1 Tax=Symbioplanes lichenis TaxID=1629072 RepID=UPI00273A266B|nr:FAD-dependent oxidoreductase [Actinoplanes lichenis]
MRIVIVGAGPVGLFAAIALGRRGHRVDVVERDPGPGAGRRERRGVPQFGHPHWFRRPVADAFAEEMPDVDAALARAGAHHVRSRERDEIAGIRCRRSTLERVLRQVAAGEKTLTLRHGTAVRVLHHGGRATGVQLRDGVAEADLVINAAGASGRYADEFRAPAERVDSGMSYLSRHYRIRPGAGSGPINSPLGFFQFFDGFAAAVFLQDGDTIGVVVIRPTADERLAALRSPRVFDAAARAIPGLDRWTSPACSRPLTSVLSGGTMRSLYRGQLDDQGAVGLPGLLHLGDAVCVTNPISGRGVATGLLQARQLVGSLDGVRGIGDATLAFDAWCVRNIRPWYDDHVAWDADLLGQWTGDTGGLPAGPLTSGRIFLAAFADRDLKKVVSDYSEMRILPTALAAVEPRAREILTSGWQPPRYEGPTRDELARLVT